MGHVILKALSAYHSAKNSGFHVPTFFSGEWNSIFNNPGKETTLWAIPNFRKFLSGNFYSALDFHPGISGWRFGNLICCFMSRHVALGKHWIALNLIIDLICRSKYVLLDVLSCSITENFYELCGILTSP